MTEFVADAGLIANFLRQHPDFFQQHADVFATLKVPHPHGMQAISLGERQILALRQQNRDLQLQLTALKHAAQRNQDICEKIFSWCEALIAESDTAALPERLIDTVKGIFHLESAALRLWNLPGLPDIAQTDAPSENVRTFADSLITPYCGPDTGFESAEWLDKKAASIAIIALRPEPDAPSCGLLVLGSADIERFTEDMSTDLLEHFASVTYSVAQRLTGGQA